MTPTPPREPRTSVDADGTPTIDANELREWLASGRPVSVLDVRSPGARAEWSIPGSRHVDASGALKAGAADALADVDLPREIPVVAVCNAGNSSRLAVRALRARGYDALSLAGGMRAWSLAWNTAAVPLPGGEAHVLQVRRTGKGCLSYVVASGAEAAVIDASVDPAVYQDLARERGWRITSVLETHVHADHLSRGPALAERTGAALRLPEQDRVSFPFAPVREGDAVRVGALTLEVLRLPGHTLESTAYLLEGRALFSGDTLFLSGVGRPDLEATPEETRARAHALYASLRRLLALPGDTLVLPAHTGEPVAFGAPALVARLDELRDREELLRAPEEAFVAALLGRIPPTPPNHHRIVELNEAGTLPASAAEIVELEAGANRCAIR